MNTASRWQAVTLLAVMAAVASAQQQPTGGEDAQPQAAGDKSEDKPKKPTDFPEPLEQATSNLPDLEKTGFVSVVAVEDRAVDPQGRRGFVWTISPDRAMTARHLQTLLRGFRDVRFYGRRKSSLAQLHSTMLHYSSRIDNSASNGVIFTKDDQFEMWIVLDDNIRRKLAKQQVDVVVFRRLKE